MKIVAVGRGLEVHPLAEFPLDVDLRCVGRFRACAGIGLDGKSVAVEQLKRAGVAKTAPIEKLVRPVRALIDQSRPGRNETVTVLGFVDAEPYIQSPSFR